MTDELLPITNGGRNEPQSSDIVGMVTDLRDPWQEIPHSERERIAEALIELNNRACAAEAADALQSLSERNAEQRKALDELFYWHDQCMTRSHVSGLESASFKSAWRELNIRVVRCASLTKGGK